MINLMKRNDNSKNRLCSFVRFLGAVTLGTMVMFAVPVAADEIADLKAENDALKGQIETLAGDLQELRDAVMKNQQAVADVKEASASSKPVIRSGKKDTSLSISGQVNRMVFYADNGDQARWFHADNDLSSTRVRFVGKSKLDDVWAAGTNIEVQFESNSTADVTIDQNTAVAASNSFTERKLELWFSNKDLGKLTLGQGPSASDGSVETDLSGTTAISSSNLITLGDSLAFRVTGTRGTASGVTVGDMFSNQDGLSRDDRLRYDTPTFAGTKLSTSWVDGDEWDVAARYGRKFDGTEMAFAASYWDASPTSQKTGFGLSASVKAPFGTSLTGSYSSEDLEATGRDDEKFWHVKLGHDFKMTDLGGTAVSINYADTEDQGANNREGTFYSLAAVQKISKLSTDLYAIIGVYDADIPAIQTENITVGGFGARIKF
jgi:hypothetical protein